MLQNFSWIFYPLYLFESNQLFLKKIWDKNYTILSISIGWLAVNIMSPVIGYKEIWLLAKAYGLHELGRVAFRQQTKKVR